MNGRTAAGIAIFIVVLNTGAQQRQDIGVFNIDEVRRELAQQSGAGDSGAVRPAQTRQKVEGWGTVSLRVTGYLALVIVLILALIWALKKTGLIGAAARSLPGSMDALETLQLGQGRSVVLVRVMDSVLVLGQTAHSITLLDKIEGQKALDLISSTKGGSSIVQFKDMFSTFLGKMKKPA